MAVINNIKELTRGDTGMYSITLYDEDGAEYIPDENDALTFYLLKKDCDDLTEAIDHFRSILQGEGACIKVKQ